MKPLKLVSNLLLLSTSPQHPHRLSLVTASAHVMPLIQNSRLQCNGPLKSRFPLQPGAPMLIRTQQLRAHQSTRPSFWRKFQHVPLNFSIHSLILLSITNTSLTDPGMTQPYLSQKLQILELLNEQVDQVKSKKSLKLNGVLVHINVSLSEVVECIHEFLYSYQPPLLIERISLQSNHISQLPANFSIISDSVRYLDLHNNPISVFPSVLRECRNLEILDLSSNSLSFISRHDLVSLVNLKVISLKENKFKYLPPILGELASLNLIEVADNPLLVPSPEVIKAFQKQSPDLDWVHELKHYLVTNANLLDLKLAEVEQQHQLLLQLHRHHQRLHSNAVPTPPPIARSRSISETKSKSSKAARRMGLIIKKNDEPAAPGDEKVPSPGDSMSALSLSHNDMAGLHPEFASPLQMPHSASATETTFTISTPPPTISTTTATTVPNSLAGSPSGTPLGHPNPPQVNISSSSSSTATLSRPGSSNRSRSNTLKDIDSILEKHDSVDTEHKSGAYFRRLSTLQELPVDENTTPSRVLQSIAGSNLSSSNSSRKGSLSQQLRDTLEAHDDVEPKSGLLMKTPPTIRSHSLSSAPELSPSKAPSTRASVSHDVSTLVKVSRKILFSFSELHSSVRRFSGFSVDKKTTIKMVSLLYATKSNIDALVENLEVIEETGNNLDQIVVSLHMCISSFRSIMVFLSDSFSVFVAKIDVCFIRMLYLTLYGSFNELYNAYRLLVPTGGPSKVIQSVLSSTALSTLDPKSLLSKPAAIAGEVENFDEKLYKTIDLATTNAQVVFSELTKAINKSTVASTAAGQPLNPSVAAKVKELTAVCMSSMDINKRLQTKLITIRNNPSHITKKLFWDDINLFLKAVIQTFSSVKIIMKDLPILNDVRASMANLTKTTKDVTIMLEVSSYKSMSDTPSSLAQTSVPNLFTPLLAHPSNLLLLANLAALGAQQLAIQAVRTPLVATLGPAAQAIIPSTGSDPANTSFSSVTSPLLTPSHGGMATAPAQSMGLYYAKNGMNPFDGLIMASREYKDGDR